MNSKDLKNKETYEKPDLERLLQDVQAIKAMLHKHDSLIRKILLPKYFGIMSSYLGASIVLIFGAFESMRYIYGSYTLIPLTVKVLLWIFFSFAMISSSIIKLVSLTRASRELSGPGNWFSLMREFFILPLRHVYIASGISACTVSIFLVLRGLALLIIPIIVLLIGIIWNQIGEFIRSRSYLMVGYWLIVSGGLSLFFVESYPFAVLAISPGLGFLLFGLLGVWEGWQDRKTIHG
ncbi:MAG: hypothetical protein SNJ56_06875 [Termitinemataceae bacterium]